MMSSLQETCGSIHTRYIHCGSRSNTGSDTGSQSDGSVREKHPYDDK